VTSQSLSKFRETDTLAIAEKRLVSVVDFSQKLRRSPLFGGISLSFRAASWRSCISIRVLVVRALTGVEANGLPIVSTFQQIIVKVINLGKSVHCICRHSHCERFYSLDVTTPGYRSAIDVLAVRAADFGDLALGEITRNLISSS
jgi:hypothetical protein